MMKIIWFMFLLLVGLGGYAQTYHFRTDSIEISVTVQKKNWLNLSVLKINMSNTATSNSMYFIRKFRMSKREIVEANTFMIGKRRICNYLRFFTAITPNENRNFKFRTRKWPSDTTGLYLSAVFYTVPVKYENIQTRADIPDNSRLFLSCEAFGSAKMNDYER